MVVVEPIWCPLEEKSSNQGQYEVKFKPLCLFGFQLNGRCLVKKVPSLKKKGNEAVAAKHKAFSVSRGIFLAVCLPIKKVQKSNDRV